MADFKLQQDTREHGIKMCNATREHGIKMCTASRCELAPAHPQALLPPARDNLQKLKVSGSDKVSELQAGCIRRG